VLRELHATLKPRGVLFSSNPRAATRKAGIAAATAVHDSNGGAGIWPTPGSTSLPTTTGPRPAGEQQPWLAVVARRGA